MAVTVANHSGNYSRRYLNEAPTISPCPGCSFRETCASTKIEIERGGKGRERGREGGRKRECNELIRDKVKLLLSKEYLPVSFIVTRYLGE